jgi:HEAT repeat protein
VRAGFDTGDATVTTLRAGLVDANARHRVLALRGFVRRELVTSETWLDTLGDADATVRREALGQLAYARSVDERVRAQIRERMNDDDALVVDAAAFALGELCDADAVDHLSVVATTHDDPRCREAAVAALGSIGDDRGRSAVLAALDDKAPIRRRAIVALSNFEGPDIESALERAKDDRDWQVRAALDQLGRNED